MRAPGATPTNGSRCFGAAAMMPATPLPWFTQSRPALVPVSDCSRVTRPLSCWLPDTPLSITATFSPWPVLNCHASRNPSTCCAQGTFVPGDDRSPSCRAQFCAGCCTWLGDDSGAAADPADPADAAAADDSAPSAGASARTCHASSRAPANTTTATRMMNAPPPIAISDTQNNTQ
jgi:hypothetical protein